MGRNNQNSKWAPHQQKQVTVEVPNSISKPLKPEVKVSVPVKEETPVEVKFEAPAEVTEEVLEPVQEEVQVEEPKIDLKPLSKKNKNV